MAKADIEVLFHAVAQEYGMPRVEPGGTLSGTVRVTPDGDVRCNHLWVKLEWHTEGRGDRDRAEAKAIDIYQGTLTEGTTGEYPFAFDLPLEPWSYAGHYIHIVWNVLVDVDVPWSVNPRQAAPFILAPARGNGSGGSDTEGEAIADLDLGLTPGERGFDVVMMDAGERSDEVVRAIQKSDPRQGLIEIKERIATLPATVLRNLTQEQAYAASDRLMAAGAQVVVKPADEEGYRV